MRVNTKFATPILTLRSSLSVPPNAVNRISGFERSLDANWGYGDSLVLKLKIINLNPKGIGDVASRPERTRRPAQFCRFVQSSAMALTGCGLVGDSNASRIVLDVEVARLGRVARPRTERSEVMGVASAG